MKKILRLSLSRNLLIALMLVASGAGAQISQYSFSQSSGTYAPITGGTVLAAATQPVTYLDNVGAMDDYIYPSCPLPFTFHFAGARTSFRPVSNGYIAFGPAAPGFYNASFPISDPAYSGIIAPMAIDLNGNYTTTGTTTAGSNVITNLAYPAPAKVGAPIVGDGIPANTTITAVSGNTITISGNATSSHTNTQITWCTGEIRMEVTGVAPNRTAIIQYSGMSWKGVWGVASGVNSLVSFQIRLAEGGGIPENQTVSIVYGPCQNTQPGPGSAQVGLRGLTPLDFSNRTSTNGWVTTSAGPSVYHAMSWSASANPASGLTYTWTPPPACTVPAQPSALTLYSGATRIAGSFTAPTPGADKYLVLRTPLPLLTGQPADGYYYAPGEGIGTGTVVSYAPGDSFTASGLQPGTTYYFYVFAVNDLCAGGPVYNLVNPLTASATTGVPTAFHWSPAGSSTDGALPGNWTPARWVPDPTDTLYFSSGGSQTVINLKADTVARIGVINGSDVTLTSGGTPVILMRHSLLVDANSSLHISGLSNLTLRFASGGGQRSATIAGDLVLGGTGLFIYNGNNCVTNVTGSLTISQNSEVMAPPAQLLFGPGSTLHYDRNGGDIPLGVYDAASTIHVTGITTAAPSSPGDIGHLIWDCPNQTAVGLRLGYLMNIGGSFQVVSTGTGSIRFYEFAPIINVAGPFTVSGGSLRLTGNIMNLNGGMTMSGGTLTGISPTPINVNGDFVQTGGTITSAANTAEIITLNTTGDFSRTGGTISATGAGSIKLGFTGNTTQQVTPGGIIAGTINYLHANPAGLNLNTNLVLNNNATLTVAVPGSNLFSGTGSVVYSGSNTSLIYETGGGAQTATAVEWPLTGGPANIEINNTSTAPDNKVILDGDRTITGTLTFTHGRLDMGANTLSQAAGSTVYGASQSTGWVTGRLEKTFAAGGINRTYQIGDDLHYTPVTLSGPSGAVTAGGTITVHTTPGDHPSINYAQLNPGQSVNRHYTVQTGGGISFAPGSLAMGINWNATDVDAGALPLTFVAARNTGGTAWENLTVSGQTAASIQINGLSGLDGSYQVATFQQTPLDIRLLTFTGEEAGTANKLTWTTSSEDAGDRFALERSTDGKSFATLGIIAGKGTASVYTYMDHQPEPANFYRLRTIDPSGAASYSSIVKILRKGAEPAVAVFPNPARESITVSLGREPRNGIITVIDLTGRTVRQLAVASADTRVDLADLPAGNYIVRFMDDQTKSTVKITKQ